jgi:hypothetical protein
MASRGGCVVVGGEAHLAANYAEDSGKRMG